MPASVRAVILAALQAAAGAALPLVATQSWQLAGATFAVVLALSVLSNWFHLNLTPQQTSSLVAALVPAVERLIPALIAFVERQPAPPVTVVTQPTPPTEARTYFWPVGEQKPTPAEPATVTIPTVQTPTTISIGTPVVVTNAPQPVPAPTPVPAPEPPAAPAAPPTP